MSSISFLNLIIFYLRILKNTDCFDLIDPLRTNNCPGPQVSPVNLCASSVNGDICKGDSGGGLVALDKYEQ